VRFFRKSREQLRDNFSAEWQTARRGVSRLYSGERERVLYTGVTGNLERRVLQHKKGLLAGSRKSTR